MGWLMSVLGRWKEWGETLGPALLAAAALLLDLAEDGEGFVHAVAVGVLALAAALSLASGGGEPRALRALAPRRGGSRSGAPVVCSPPRAASVLEVVQRLPAPRLAADHTLQLTVLGARLGGPHRLGLGPAELGADRPRALRLEAEETARAQAALREVDWAGAEVGEA